jgi:transposase
MIDIAMDVHVRNSFVHATDGGGQVVVKGRSGNTLLELSEMLAPVERLARERAEPVRVTIENTTNARGILRLAAQYGKEAGLDLSARALDPRKVRVIAESVCKCDRLDAAVLNELARSNLRLPVCYFPDDEEFALREHLRARADLVRLRTMVKNRVHALLHRRAILAPSGDLFTRAGRAFLDQVELDREGAELRDRFLATMAHIDTQIKASDGDLKRLAALDRWREQAERLRTMPGVGPITALTVLAELGDIHRFGSRAAVSNYAGLVPVLRESNAKGYSGPITHRGPALLRAVLVQAAWTALPRAPAYEAIFERIKPRGGPQKAIVAVARRMLEDLWTMLKKKESFRYVRPFGTGTRAGDPAITGASDAG